MKKLILILIFTATCIFTHAQSCEEYLQLVKSKSQGTTYTSSNSTAISKVTFYNVTLENEPLNFAIVCFKGKRATDSLLEYIYKVEPDTESIYASNYKDSAGKAFWKYIQPFNASLDCAPNINSK
ncbi:hypothetical protein [Crocinitomix catalasitica]|uniref:hypothetical protein n=1 Tax=Crocinitomix catalasitica TaxID=184607 RepID=UPI0004821CF2|nr:hypothetical protein [Crocinitomix catalasitica]